MRTRILYFDRRLSWQANLAALLEFRDAFFDRLRVPRHRVRWVQTSSLGGYWTT